MSPSPRPSSNPPTTPSEGSLAARLLDAQTAFIVAQLTGPDLADLLVNDVDDFLAAAADIPLAQVLPPEAVKLVAHRLVDVAGDSALIVSLIDTIADAVYDLPAAADHRLGDVAAREHVAALVAKVLSMHRTQDAIMERLVESPAVANIAAKFVGKLVSDVVNQNRERVEKLPGAKSLMSIGFGAANRVRNAAGDTFTDAAGRSAQFAIKRTNSATREVLRDTQLHDAALELWDLQAGEPIADLRRFVSAADVRELAQVIRQLVADARGTEYAAALLDGVVDALFETYGSTDVAALLTDLGLGRADLLFVLQQVARPLLDVLRETGRLEHVVRSRLAPFYASSAFADATD